MSCISINHNNSLLHNNCGSAIVLVISVGALVTLLVFTWIVFSAQQSKTLTTLHKRLNARYAAESVVSKAILEQKSGIIVDDVNPDTLGAATSPELSSTTTVSYEDSLHEATATATIDQDGPFMKIIAEGLCGSSSMTVEAQFGLKLPVEFRYALILSQQNQPLIIQKGRIIGDAWLPIAPQGRIDGTVTTENAALPPYNESQFDKQTSAFDLLMTTPSDSETVLFGSQSFNRQKQIPIKDGEGVFVNGSVLIENRSMSPLIIKGPAKLIVSGNLQISGNIWIQDLTILSLGDIVGLDQARFQNTIMYTKESIHLSDEASFEGLLFAPRIILSAEATVSMPTVAFMKGSLGDSAQKKSGFYLSDQSRFSGTAVSTVNSYSVIERSAVFTGLFYSSGELQLEGTVIGCVAVAALRESKKSPEKNILSGGTINRPALPNTFVVPRAFSQASKDFTLVSWKETEIKPVKKVSTDE